jgi:hypothetical protein
MSYEEIKEQLSNLGVKYLYLIHGLDSNNKKDKKLIEIYELMVKMLEKISIKPCRYVYFVKGKEINELIMKNKSSNADEVHSDLIYIYSLLGGKQEYDRGLK